MEPTEVIVARLVLGYLKNEHCRTAYKAFLVHSRHFHHTSQTKDKYLQTRFVGLTLEDILNEYFEIYHIVQGRLEATNYFNEKRSRTNLPNQLLYLLHKGHSISRTSTPCPRSPIDSHLDETSPSHQDPNSDVETTPAHTLPGNIPCFREETYLQNIPRRKQKTAGSPGDSEQMDEVLAQTLLENKEFQEKIAQTINKVAEKQHRVSAGLDNTIKTVVRETEEDPMFDKILEEIIGSTIMDNHAKFETNSTESSVAHSSSEVLDHRLNKSNKKTDVCDTSQAIMSTEIEGQNNEAVQSIVANSLIVNKNQPIPIDGGQINNEVVVFDGSLDKYLVNSGCSIVTAPIKTPVYINTMGLLIPTNVQQGLKPTTDTKYFINNPQVNWNDPLNTVNNQDILSMPTVIVTEKKKKQKEKRPCGGQKKVPKPPIPHVPQEIMPKPTIESVVFLNIPPEPKTVLEIPESANATGLKKVIYPKVTNSSLNDRPQPPEVSNQPLSASTPASSKFSNDLPEIMTEKEEANIENETDKMNKTPPPSENVQKVTPKSASHIRNLDFSTPPKVTPSCKKSRKKSGKSPVKKQAAKSLFKKEEPPANKEPRKAWDSDLRAVAAHPNSKNVDTPRRVTNRTASKTRKKVKVNEKPNMNTTEKDAATLEAALQTPIKVVDKSSEEMITLEVKENNTHDNQCKTIQSPSKLNASKRNLLESEGDGKSKYVTPENTKENLTQPIKANRNIMSFLETPLKDYVPITPGIQTPMDLNLSAMSSNMTPFTKMLEANLKDIDINQLPTPNIPITPNFPELTPVIDLVSPFSNRPTDYSTSSSYYQPSDNEQNKSLEAHLLEMEKKTLEDKVETRIPQTNEHLSNFNKNIVGKKNLNLVKRDIASSSSSSDESDTDSDSDDSDSSGVLNKESNDTVIFKKIEPVPVKNYSLRLRNSSGKVQKEPDKKDPIKIDVDSIIKKINAKQVKSAVKKIKIIEENENNVTGKSLKQKSVRTDLEEKRLRVINTLKSNNSNKPQQQNNKFTRIKSFVHVHAKKRTRKAVMPKKILTPKKEDMRTILMQDLAHSDDSDWDSPLKASPNAKTAKKMVTRRSVEKNDESTSDAEAQNLIEGLKERGIHLVHNKSPKKKIKDAPQVTEQPSSSSVENKISDTSNNEKMQAESHSFVATEIRDSHDIQDFPEETISLVYDEKNTSQRAFEDYNVSDVFEKTMKAQVFVEEVNLFMHISLKVSEFHSLLEIDPNKMPTVEEKIDNNRVDVVNEDDKINDQIIRSVPEKSDTDNQVIDTNQLDNKNKQVTFIASANEDENLPGESKQITKENGQPKSKQIIVIENKCIFKPKSILKETKCEESEPADKNTTDCPQETSTTEAVQAIDPSDEELMNFAVTGSDSMSRKRKGRMEETTQIVKKCKTLLKKIDVDVFLNDIHGNSPES